MKNEPTRNAHMPLLVAYLVHLLVPLFLLSDVLLTQHIRHLEMSDKILLAVIGFWLIVGFGMFFLSPDRTWFLRRSTGPLVSIYSLYLNLLVLELLARIVVGGAQPIPVLYEPRTKWVIESDPEVEPGLSGTARFTVNEFGLRGSSLPPQGNVYRVLTIGDSATLCSYLDDSKTWPHLLMGELNRRQKSYLVWVANAGFNAYTTADHLMTLQTIPILGQAEMRIFMFGLADLEASLAFEGGSTQGQLERHAALVREQILGEKAQYPLFKRLLLYRLGRKAAASLILRFRPSTLRKLEPVDYVEMRRRRAAGPVVPLPNLEVGLKEYSERVLRIANECQALGLRCLFLTEPAVWRTGLSPAEERLLWMAWVGRGSKARGYLSVADAARAMDLYNGALLNLCRQYKLECYDLASSVPKDTSVFYDDAHFNESGARIIAQLISNYLLSTPPFDQAGRLVSGQKQGE